MPIDSGVLSTLKPKDRFLNSLQNGIAFQQSIPVTFVRRDLPEIFKHVITKAPQDLDSFPSSVFDRCQPFMTKWQEWKTFFKLLAEERYAYPPSYANPAIRLLRDYWAWSWSELLELAARLREFENSRAPFFFPANAGFNRQLSSYMFGLDESYNAILGPFLLQRNDLDSDIADVLRRDIDRFNDSVRAAWQSVPRSPIATSWFGAREINKPIYTTDYIVRLLFSRAQIQTEDVVDCSKRVRLSYNYAKSFFDQTKDGFRPDAIGRLLAAIDAAVDHNGVPDKFPFTLRVTATLPIIKQSEVRPAHYEITFVNQNESKASLRDLEPRGQNSNTPYRKKLDALYTAWNSYSYESFVILRNYLNRKFGVYATSGKETERAVSSKVGDRIIRLISKLLDAEEGAIYSIDYSQRSKPLIRYGSYTEYSHPENRRELIGDHMLRIARSQSRKASISYRAADQQRTQICMLFNQAENIAVPLEQTLSYPQGSLDDWGKSACATPIIQSGRTWGAVELISARPWNFYDENVKKVEEACTLVAPFFYYQSIFAHLSDVYRTVADPNVAFKNKIANVCKVLPSLFMADSAAIYFRQKDDRLYPFAATFREDIQPFLGSEKTIDVRATKSLECSLLEDLTIEIRDYTIGEPPFDDVFFELTENSYFRDHVGHRLVAIPLSEFQHSTEDHSSFGLITLVMAQEPNPRYLSTTEEIGGAYEFLRTYLTVASQLVYASYVWERLTRSYLSHELHRLEIEFEARLKRAKNAMNRIKDDNVSALMAQALGNLDPTLSDLRHFNSIFRSVSFVERSDPLIAAARRLRDSEENKPEAPISLREIVNEVFKSRQTQADERYIKIANLMPPVTPQLHIGRRNLTEALGNLAENAVKYARDRSQIHLSMRVVNDDVYLTISNIGPWMSEDERKHVFEEGFRGQYAIKMGASGMGRGLGYAREIMRLYGGEMRYRIRPLGQSNAPVAEGDQLWHDIQIKFPSEVLSWEGE
jgi:signal transduction histidine kinase